MCRFLGSYSLPFTPSWTGHYLGKSPHLPIKPMFSFSMTKGLLATDSTISLHRAYYSFTSPFISCYPMGLRADVPVVPTHFFINLLLRASLARFLHLYLYWALLANILAVCQPISLLHSFGFLGPFTSSLPLLLSWAFC